MTNDDDALAFLFICGLLLCLAVGTVNYLHMPVLLYIALLFAVIELIYLQLVKLEEKDKLNSIKSEDELMKMASDLKLYSIASAIIVIPFITIILLLIYALILFMKVIFMVIGGLLTIVAIWLLYIYINTYPLRLRKKQLEKDKKLEESEKHPRPKLD